MLDSNLSPQARCGLNPQGEIKMSSSVLYDFSAEWCGPCRTMKPTVDQFEATHKNVEVKRIDIDQDSDTPQKYGVRAVPTFVLVQGDQELTRVVGARSLSAFNAAIEPFLAVDSVLSGT